MLLVGFKVEAIIGEFVEGEVFGDRFVVTVVESFVIFFMEDHTVANSRLFGY